MHRASALIGRLLAEAARTVVGAALITAVGVGLGLRFEGGWLAVIPFLLVPALVAVVFSTGGHSDRGAREEQCHALLASDAVHRAGVLQLWHSSRCTCCPRGCGLLIPLQPMAPTIESMRALAQGGPALWPLLLSVGWATWSGSELLAHWPSAVIAPRPNPGTDYRIAPVSDRMAEKEIFRYSYTHVEWRLRLSAGNAGHQRQGQ